MDTLSFDDLKSEVMIHLDKRHLMVLATSADDHVTARMMSVVHRDLHLYFQTDANFQKTQQIKKNPNVALCCDNLQIEGVAAILGCWDTVTDPGILALYRQMHENSYQNYGRLDHATVIEIKITRVTLWKYEDGYALRDFLLIPEQQAFRELYSKVSH
jgi:general stress protein 26